MILRVCIQIELTHATGWPWPKEVTKVWLRQTCLNQLHAAVRVERDGQPETNFDEALNRTASVPVGQLHRQFSNL
jgi:hypothetical protein